MSSLVFKQKPLGLLNAPIKSPIIPNLCVILIGNGVLMKSLVNEVETSHSIECCKFETIDAAIS